jgi:hypothetical protein
MNNLLSGPGPGQHVTGSVEQARGRRYPPGAVRFRSKQARQLGDMGPVMRAERKAAVAIPTTSQKPAMNRARGGPAGAVMLILCAGLALEAILPWAVIWLSDMFVFDTPAWSRWLVFAVPPALSVLALALILVPGSRIQAAMRSIDNRAA